MTIEPNTTFHIFNSIESTPISDLFFSDRKPSPILDSIAVPSDVSEAIAKIPTSATISSSFPQDSTTPTPANMILAAEAYSVPLFGSYYERLSCPTSDFDAALLSFANGLSASSSPSDPTAAAAIAIASDKRMQPLLCKSEALSFDFALGDLNIAWMSEQAEGAAVSLSANSATSTSNNNSNNSNNSNNNNNAAASRATKTAKAANNPRVKRTATEASECAGDASVADSAQGSPTQSSGNSECEGVAGEYLMKRKKNNDAVKKCRARKRLAAAITEEECGRLSVENTELRDRIAVLESEVNYLKNLLISATAIATMKK